MSTFPWGAERSSADHQSAAPGASRRGFLRLVGQAGVAGLFAGATGALAAEAPVSDARATAPASTLTPDAAIERLMAGNRRFVAGRLTAHTHNLAQLRQQLAHKQEPYAAILTCADSRIPVEMVFDEPMGQLFVTRVAGNMLEPEIIASLEYGIAVLGTRAVLVMGHSDCGAIKAAIGNKAVPGQISALYPPLQPPVHLAKPDVRTVTKLNAKIQSRVLAESSTVAAVAIEQGKLKVVAGYYDIGSGQVTLLEG
jgi:carbonic anhydrase